MIELAKNAANAYVSTNENIKQANVDEFLNVYLDVFTVAYTKVEERIEIKALILIMKINSNMIYLY